MAATGRASSTTAKTCFMEGNVTAADNPLRDMPSVLSVSRDPADVREAIERAKAQPAPDWDAWDSPAFQRWHGPSRPLSDPIVAIGEDAKGTRNDGLADQLIEDYGVPELNWPLAGALLHIGGRSAERWPLNFLLRTNPVERAEIAWALEGTTLDSLQRRGRETGVIVAGLDEARLERIRSDFWDGNNEHEFRLFEPFVTLLVEARAAVHFHYDPSGPIRYDWLIARFSRCMPWFPLEAVRETIHGGGSYGEG